MTERIYDLQRLADELEKQGRHKELSAAIRRAYNVASASTDLLKVQRNLQMIQRLQKPGGMPKAFSREEGGNLIEALFVSAVVVYSRATVSTPIARQPWWGPGKLSPDLKKTHETITTLRNKEFAHFGKGMNVEGEPLLAETLYFRPNSPSPINFRANRWATRPELIYRMERLTTFVQQEAKDRMKAHFESVAGQLHAIPKFDPALRDLVARFVVNDPRLKSIPEGPSEEDGPHRLQVWTTVQTRDLNLGKESGKDH